MSGYSVPLAVVLPLEDELLLLPGVVCLAEPVRDGVGERLDETLDGDLAADGTPHQLLTDFDGRAD